MRTFTTALIGIILLMSTANTLVFAAAPTSIDAADIQHFEQTYEEWVQSLVQSVAPTNPATVLVELDYSNAPDKLQTYEELRAANHLPGLPEVTDPNFVYPSESPLYALVNQQRIKIIFEHEINANQRKVLTEVLNSKLKIKSARGDQVAFDHVNESATTGKHSPLSKKQIATFIALALAGVIIASAKRNKKEKNSNTETNSNNAFTNLAQTITAAASSIAISASPKSTKAKSLVTPPVFRLMNDKEKIAEEKALIQKMHQHHPRAHAQTAKIMSPVQIILKSNPRQLIETVRGERAENIATAMMNSPAGFSSTMAQVCTKEQLVAVKNILRTQKNKISEEKSKYAQLLLAAKINFESNPRSNDSTASEANL